MKNKKITLFTLSLGSNLSKKYQSFLKSSLFFMIIGISLSSCVTTYSKKNHSQKNELIFLESEASKLEIWKAVLTVLHDFYGDKQIKTENFNQGLVQTHFQEHEQRTTSEKSYLESEKSQITVYIQDLELPRGKAQRLWVEKKILHYKDYFSSASLKQSKGIDEKLIIYRILREVKLGKLGLRE